MRKGFYLYTPTAQDGITALSIVDRETGAAVDMWNNGIGALPLTFAVIASTPLRSALPAVLPCGLTSGVITTTKSTMLRF